MRLIDAESLEKTILNDTNFNLSKIDVVSIIASEPTVIQEHRAGIEILTQMLENQSAIMSALYELLTQQEKDGAGVWEGRYGILKHHLLANNTRTQLILRGKDA